MLFGRKKADSASGKHETTEAKLIHCPACGFPMSSLDIKCPACNCEIRNGKASTSIKNLVDSLAKIDSQKEFFLGGLIRSFTGNLSDKVNRKVETIKNFPIPNEKKDIFDLVHLAASNINAEILVAKEPEDVNLSNEDFKTQKLLVQTWSDKMESAFLKAKSLFGNDPDFSKVSDIYSAKKAEIESLIKKKKRGVTIAVAGLIAGIALMTALFVGFVIYPHHERERKLEAIAAEVRADIDNGDYESALVKANQLHMDDGYSHESNQKWNKEREGYIAIIKEKTEGKDSSAEKTKENDNSAEENESEDKQQTKDSVSETKGTDSDDKTINLFMGLASDAPILDIQDVIKAVPDNLNPQNYKSFYDYYFVLERAKKEGTISESQLTTLVQYICKILKAVRSDFASFYLKAIRSGGTTLTISFSSGLAVKKHSSSISYDYGIVTNIDNSVIRIDWDNGEYDQFRCMKDNNGDIRLFNPDTNKESGYKADKEKGVDGYLLGAVNYYLKKQANEE